MVLELLPELPRRIQRVVLDDDGPEPQHGVERDDVLGAVGQHDRDGVARADTEILQPGRHPLDLLAERAVRGLATEELERDGIGKFARGPLQDVDEAARHGSQVFWHPLGVICEQPRRRKLRLACHGRNSLLQSVNRMQPEWKGITGYRI